jgi:hypothetical protein
VVDLALQKRCIRLFAQNVKKNVKSLLNPGMTVQYTAKIVIPNVKTKDVKRKDFPLVYLRLMKRKNKVNS